MQGTTAIKQYFSSGNSKNVTPIVSAEWNHNLFHAPYSTFSGTGTLISASSSWSGSKTIDALLGRTTSVFTDTSCVKLSTSSGTGASTTSIAVSSGVNTYKITFFAKLVETATVDLVALAYIDEHRSSSVSDIIDGASWKRFELIVSAKPTDVTYSSFNLTFDHTSSDGTMSYNVLIDQLEIYQTTAFDYQYGNLWQTKSPFGWFRPGESYVPSGNSLTPLPTGFRQIQSPISSSKSWTKQMPCSPLVYHPKLVGYGSANPLFKNGILSDYSVYRYWVSDGSVNSLGAVYDELLPTNKIVLKFNLAYSTPTDITLNLSNTVTGYSSNTTISYGDISSSGVCILYRQSNGTWSTTPWTTMPTISEQGAITNSQAINKVIITQNSYLVNSNYSTSSYTTQQQMGFFQVIEISPRLELDVTQFVINLETQAELDNKQNPLPISAISANHATVSLSNIPLRVNGGPLSVFSNNSSLSPIGGLLKRNVKFYINYQINDSVSGATSQNKIISNGVYYVDEWNERDIDSNDVVLYDITKYLQLLAPSDYVAHSAGVLSIISNLLDSAGFTDYDYDSLKLVTSSSAVINNITVKNSQPIVMQYFYADGQQQKLFDVLREIFEVYQIAAYIDTHGVMKFINVDGIFDKNNLINMQLHDSTDPVSISTSGGYTNNLSVFPNIVQDTYQETTKTKVGKINFTYKTPQIERTLASDTRLLNNNLYIDYAPTFMDKTNAIWDSTIDEMATYNTLSSTMNTFDTYFTVPTSEAIAASTKEPVFRTYSIDHNGYAIIENEIVSFKYKEFSYIGNTFNTTRSVSSSSEFSSKLAEISALAGNEDFKVQATGRITNVDRGQFNTPVSSHIVMSSPSDIQQRFDVSGAYTTPYITNGNIVLSGSSSGISSITALDPYSTNGSLNNYNTFSAKILMGPNSSSNYPDGTSAGVILHNSSQSPSVYVFVTKSTISGTTKYILNATSSSFNGSSLISTGSIDITKIVNGQANSYKPGSPFEDYGKYINLKFVKTNNSSNAFELFVNKTHIPIKTTSTSAPDTSGKFGIFSTNSSAGLSPVQFAELYATQTALTNPGDLHHYDLPWFAEKLASNKKIFEISYMVQSTPSIVGINYYDIRDTNAPSLDAYPLKLSYNWYYYTDGSAPKVIPVNSSVAKKVTNATAAGTLSGTTVSTSSSQTTIPLPFVPVNEDSLTYSPIYHSGFKSRFAIINSSPGQVWIKKSPDPVNKINVDFSLITRSLVTLGNDVIISKVFDEANSNETVDITTSWVQDENTATAILRSIYRALDGFTRDTTISIYGNPLYEIGDIVILNYGLKNIVNQKYFVQGITQNFDTGLTTTLVLNQIG
jgi:hypothetical protein